MDAHEARRIVESNKWTSIDKDLEELFENIKKEAENERCWLNWYGELSDMMISRLKGLGYRVIAFKDNGQIAHEVIWR